MKFKLPWPALLTLLLVVLTAVPSSACAPLAEFEKRVEVVDESAVIVWDEKTKTQHFIRRATFDSNGKSVGFLVPTPTVPELAEADAGAFWRLEEVIKPKVVFKEFSRYRLMSYLSGGRIANTFNAAGRDMSSDGVEVVSTQRVGDFDATVLRATNAKSLNRWLSRHGYHSSSAFEKWLQVYVRQGWVVTAFKISKSNPEATAFSSNLVRMSFTTPRPFFPYHEPQTQVTGASNKKRSLRVYFFAQTRMKSEAGNFNSQRTWPGRIKWADDTNNHGFKESSRWHWLAEDLSLPESTLTKARWMTVFEDTNPSRPGTDDVFFKSDTNKITLPEPIIVDKPVRKPIFIEYFFLAWAGVGGLAVFLLRRR